MFARTKWLRGLGVAALAAMALTACEDTIVQVPETPPPPPPPLTIVATPAQINLLVGQTQQIVATVSGGAEGTSRAVNFSSSNTAVATVSAEGVVTGVAPGTATIIAAAAADPDVRAGVGVTVTTEFIPPTEDAEITVLSITQFATNVPVNPDNVFGQIDVTMAVERGDATRLVVLLNGEEVRACRQEFGAASEPSELTATGLRLAEGGQGGAIVNVICSINTAAWDRDDAGPLRLRGVPMFLNDTYQLEARLERNGEVLDAARPDPLVFNNQDFMEVLVSTRFTGTANLKPSVIGNDGFLWYGHGDWVFEVVPVIFSGPQGSSGDIARATLGVSGQVAGTPANPVRTSTTQVEGGHRIIFPRSAAVANNSWELNTGAAGVVPTVMSVTVGGQPGPSTATGTVTFRDLQSGTAIANSLFRGDNEMPDAGVLALTGHPALPATDPDAVSIRNGWINGPYVFAGGKAGHNDMPFNLSGVGLPAGAVTFHASTATTADTWANNAAIADANPAITNASTLAQSLTNSEYIVVAQVVDILGNRNFVRLSTGPKATGTVNRVGVDHSIPLMTRLADVSQYNPQGGVDNIFQVGLRDHGVIGIDGFSGPAVIIIRAFRFRPTPTETQVDSVTSAGLTSVQKFLPSAFAGVTDVTHEFDTNDLLPLQAYLMFDGVGWDRAGNRTEEPDVTSRVFIIDLTAPVVSNVNIPIVTLFAGGTAYPFAVTATDNVDLRAGHFGFDFANGWSLPVHPFDVSPWLRPIVPRTERTENMTFIRGLELVTAGGAPAGSPSSPEWVRARVWDHSHPVGRHSTQANNLVANTVPAPGPSYSTRGVVTTELSANGRTFTVSGQTGTFVNPFNRVYFIHEVTDPVTMDTHWRILPGSVTITVEDVGTGPEGRKWIFTFVGSIPTDTNIRVVGVNASGDALLSLGTTTPPPPAP